MVMPCESVWRPISVHMESPPPGFKREEEVKFSDEYNPPSSIKNNENRNNGRESLLRFLMLT